MFKRQKAENIKLKTHINLLYEDGGNLVKRIDQIRESDHHQVLSDRQVLLDQTMARMVRVLMQFCDSTIETLPTHRRLQRHALSMRKKLSRVVNDRVKKASGELFLSPDEWKKEAEIEEETLDEVVSRLQG
jgi:hypothetical protein